MGAHWGNWLKKINNKTAANLIAYFFLGVLLGELL